MSCVAIDRHNATSITPKDEVDQAYDQLLSRLNEKNADAGLASSPDYRTTNLVNKIVASIRPVPCKFAQGLMP